MERHDDRLDVMEEYHKDSSSADGTSEASNSGKLVICSELLHTDSIVLFLTFVAGFCNIFYRRKRFSVWNL